MAATVANTEYNVIGAGPGGKWVYSEITLDSAYAVGGETVSAAAFGLARFKAIFVAFNEDGYIIKVALNTAKDTATITVYVTGNATTSAATAVESSVRDLGSVVIPVLIRGV